MHQGGTDLILLSMPAGRLQSTRVRFSLSGFWVWWFLKSPGDSLVTLLCRLPRLVFSGNSDSSLSQKWRA